MRHFSRLVLAPLLSLAPAAPGFATEVVYDNSANVTASVGADLDEFGDEVALAGSARTVTDFSFLYSSSFELDGDESVRIRFYLNDGSGGAPGTLHFDSGDLAVGATTGFQEYALTGLSVTVPDSFTWTVQFGGMTGAGNDRALLAFADPPSVGSSDATFYWFSVGAGGWAQFAPGGQGNLYARVTAVPEPGTGLLTLSGLLVLCARRLRHRPGSRCLAP